MRDSTPGGIQAMTKMKCDRPTLCCGEGGETKVNAVNPGGARRVQFGNRSECATTRDQGRGKSDDMSGRDQGGNVKIGNEKERKRNEESGGEEGDIRSPGWDVVLTGEGMELPKSSPSPPRSATGVKLISAYSPRYRISGCDV